MRQTTVFAGQTKQLGQSIGKKLRPGQVLALAGDLGSGKTTFVQGLAAGLGIRHKIKSPTFVIFIAYPIPKSRLVFYHFDLYRLRRPSDLRDLGFAEIINNMNHITAVEWPKQAKPLLPPHTKWIYFKHDPRNPNNRILASS